MTDVNAALPSVQARSDGAWFVDCRRVSEKYAMEMLDFIAEVERRRSEGDTP